MGGDSINHQYFKKSTKTINCINVDDHKVTNPIEIAHSFNKFACTVAQKIEDITKIF